MKAASSFGRPGVPTKLTMPTRGSKPYFDFVQFQNSLTHFEHPLNFVRIVTHILNSLSVCFCSIFAKIIKYAQNNLILNCFWMFKKCSVFCSNWSINYFGREGMGSFWATWWKIMFLSFGQNNMRKQVDCWNVSEFSSRWLCHQLFDYVTSGVDCSRYKFPKYVLNSPKSCANDHSGAPVTFVPWEFSGCMSCMFIIL